MTDVCVVGSFMMDLVLTAPTRPGPGETIVGTSFEMFLGGKGFNQAVAAARSGASTAMVGRLGADDFGHRFLAALDREGIDARHVLADPGCGTGVGLPLVEDNGDNSIVVVPQANHKMTVEHIEAARPVIAGSRVLVLQLELPLDVVVAAARIGHVAGARVVLTPAPVPPSLGPLRHLVDVLVPNEVEAGQLTGIECAGEGARLAAQRLRHDTGARAVVLTLGAHGVLVAADDDCHLVPAHRVVCLDSIGAGDALCGAMTGRLALGATLGEAVEYGNAAGALAVTRRGAEPSMPFATEIDELLSAAAPS